MKRIGKAFLGVFFFAIAVTLSGLLYSSVSELFSQWIPPWEKTVYEEQYLAAESLTYVGFSAEEKIEPEDAASFESYESSNRAYSSLFYYQTLTEEEQKVYRLLEYAFDHSYPSIFIEKSYFSESGREVNEIIELFSLDSALLEQNLDYTVAERTYTFSYGEGLFSFQRTGVELQVNNFTADRMEKRQEALEFAEAYVNSLPVLSAEETAFLFYRDMLEDCCYAEYPKEEDAARHYLYDAVVEKSSQCDGFTNAYALYCHLAQIQVLEKKDVPSEGRDGHTWNSVCLGEVWYNVDLALSDETRQMERENALYLNFCFSDERLEEKNVAFSEVVPPCSENRMKPLAVYEGYQTAGQIREIASLLKNSQGEWVLVCILSGKGPEDWLQRIANASRGRVHSIYDIVGEKTYHYLKKE